MKKKIKVLIVDDSASVRQVLKEILESEPSIEVMATACDAYEAVKVMKNEVPDVITLDIEMPRMNGLNFLKKIMSQHPIPVVIISTLTQKGSKIALKALDYGAIEVIAKPKIDTARSLSELRITICDKVMATAISKIKRRQPIVIQPNHSADVILKKKIGNGIIRKTEQLIALGASTGGTIAIQTFLESLPIDAPGIVIVQHMPEFFTEAFASRLNDICRINVKEASHGDDVIQGRALIAPGNKHMLVKRSGSHYFVELKDGPLVNRHKPSVDVLFRSVARYVGKNASGVLMTGMGSDGANGLLEMKEQGALTIAQDEASSIVFGMPKEAIKINAALKVLPLKSIASFLCNTYNLTAAY